MTTTSVGNDGIRWRLHVLQDAGGRSIKHPRSIRHMTLDSIWVKGRLRVLACEPGGRCHELEHVVVEPSLMGLRVSGLESVVIGGRPTHRHVEWWLTPDTLPPATAPKTDLAQAAP